MPSDGPREVRFRRDRRDHRAPAGATLAGALAEEAAPLLQRSVRYHRPRAPFCGIGACTNCLVRVNGVPNVRACRYEPREGDRVASENVWPSTRYDLWASLDLLLRHGFDSVRGFRRPAFFRPVYQRVVRRLAGFGTLPDPGAGSPPGPPRLLEADVAVIGAGVAGRAAAARLVELGRRPLLVDRGPLPEPPTGVEAVPGVTLAFLPPPGPAGGSGFTALGSSEDGRGVRLRTRQLLLSTGAFDANLWFGDGDRPGVMTVDGVRALEAPGRAPPFRHALLVGGGPRAADALARWGERIEAVAAPGSIDPPVVLKASELDVPLYPRSLLLRALGRRRVRGAELRGRGGGPTTRLEVDAIVLAHRRLPHNQLLFQVGAALGWSKRPGAYYPKQVGGATSVRDLAVAGELLGLRDPSERAASGRQAAEALQAGRPWPTEFPPVDEAGPSEFEGYYRELLPAPRPGGRWIACPCEDIGLEEVEEAHRRGYRGIEVVKRYTGLGTGLCQGRYCVPEAVLLLANLEGRPPSEVGYITQRPPVLPVRLDALASLPDAPEPP